MKQIDSHIKHLRALKAAAATPRSKKMVDRHIAKATKLRKMATSDCEAFFLPV